MTNITDFENIFNWVIAHGYFFIFLVMCAEGPFVTAAAGFAAALGYFNPWLILLLSIAGDLVPDSIYYYIGYFGRLKFIENIGHRFGVTQARIDHLEELLKRHFGKTMIVLKLTPLLSAIGFVLVGYLRRSYPKFIKYCTVVTLPKSIIFLTIGFFFGHLYNINEYLHNASILFPVAVILAVGGYIGYGKISLLIGKKIEKI